MDSVFATLWIFTNENRNSCFSKKCGNVQFCLFIITKISIMENWIKGKSREDLMIKNIFRKVKLNSTLCYKRGKCVFSSSVQFSVREKREQKFIRGENALFPSCIYYFFPDYATKWPYFMPAMVPFFYFYFLNLFPLNCFFSRWNHFFAQRA